MKEFAERLKKLRISAGLSQRALATKVGISATAIRQWEDETCIPNAEAVVMLAKFFGVTSDYLLGMSDCMLINQIEK